MLENSDKRARACPSRRLCPYTLCAGTDTTTDVELLPVTTHADIVNYLVLWTNHVSLTEMKAYKSLKAHNYFTSGRVSGVTAKRLPSKRVIVLSEVKLFSRRLLTEVIVCIDHFRRRMGNLCRLNVSCVRGCGHLSLWQPIFGALVPRSRVNARCCAVAVSQVLARHPIRSKVPVKQQKIRNGLERDPESSCEV
ncbi:hypothetical protein HPB52_019066 [Rhipicephalus sanguineus]|uniref:Uncharacterized protein n=1 Tax=Rhipicephalus sanguineus TaxID=34632 RepID=A0A9D4Q228_RHISA|nr:hypothetical protein HPB52_019066 [Rhipicephalus sanguineus]